MYEVNAINTSLIMYLFKLIFPFCQKIMSTPELCGRDTVLTHDMETYNKLAEVASDIMGQNLKK